VLDAKYRTLARVSIGVVRSAHLNILRNRISARTNVAVPPCSCIRAGPKHPNIVLPYSKHVTANACTNCILTLLLCSPSSLAWHLILLNAAVALQIRFYNIILGLALTLSINKPKYLNSVTFSIGRLLHIKITSMLIYMALVFPTFILRPFNLQNSANAFTICYRPSALCEISTASSAKAKKNIYRVAISRIKRLVGSKLCN
jgi:hypothetical protein